MVKLLDGVQATGAGTSFVLPSTISRHTVDCYFTNSGGSVTALTVDLEGSIDGVKFYTLASYTFDNTDLNNKQAMFHATDKMVNYVRANITTLTETGTTAVYVRYILERKN